ncbi:hypothetical protein T492DRAFT_238482 [Pavlovales sp. CCMP2436]|nr:hypothetical protein T492DRAFT_238482 [Pavlovales sp. CCMP2436]
MSVCRRTGSRQTRRQGTRICCRRCPGTSCISTATVWAWTRKSIKRCSASCLEPTRRTATRAPSSKRKSAALRSCRRHGVVSCAGATGATRHTCAPASSMLTRLASSCALRYATTLHGRRPQVRVSCGAPTPRKTLSAQPSALRSIQSGGRARRREGWYLPSRAADRPALMAYSGGREGWVWVGQRRPAEP